MLLVDTSLQKWILLFFLKKMQRQYRLPAAAVPALPCFPSVGLDASAVAALRLTYTCFIFMLAGNNCCVIYRINTSDSSWLPTANLQQWQNITPSNCVVPCIVEIEMNSSSSKSLLRINSGSWEESEALGATQVFLFRSKRNFYSGFGFFLRQTSLQGKTISLILVNMVLNGDILFHP